MKWIVIGALLAVTPAAAKAAVQHKERTNGLYHDFVQNDPSSPEVVD